MLEIREQDYISEGQARKVYQHPQENELCIKIGKPEIEENHLYKEIKYYKKIRHKNTGKFGYQFYSQFLGEIKTNLGTGFIYQLVKDETTNEISLTLRHYLEMDTSPVSDSAIQKGLLRLKEEMIKHKVFVGDLRARNICVKRLKNGGIELVVIDGLGHRDFFPFADWFTYFAKKKVNRRFYKANLNSLEAQRNLLKSLREAGAKYV